MKTFKKIIYESCGPAIGAMLLIGLLRPFGLDRYEHGILVPSLGVGVFTFLATFITLVLNAYVLKLNLEPSLTVKQYLRRVSVKYIINMCILSVPLVSFASWVWHNDWSYWWFDAEGHFTIRNYFECMWQVAVIGVFILIWDLYQFRNQKLKAELEDIRIINGLLEQRQRQLEEKSEETASVASSEPTAPPAVITLSGQVAKSSLTFCPAELLYVESVSNYAYFYYLSEGQVRSSSLRLTLRSICASLQDYEMLAQCHRAFLVNLNYVESLHTTSTSTYVLRLFSVDKEIPVSRTFLSGVKAKLERK